MFFLFLCRNFIEGIESTQKELVLMGERCAALKPSTSLSAPGKILHFLQHICDGTSDYIWMRGQSYLQKVTTDRQTADINA